MNVVAGTREAAELAETPRVGEASSNETLTAPAVTEADVASSSSRALAADIEQERRSRLLLPDDRSRLFILWSLGLRDARRRSSFDRRLVASLSRAQEPRRARALAA
jgi:hypothetical protein